jgi:hypothetical protein
MRNGMTRILILTLATLAASRTASAQCGHFGHMGRDVGITPANPFQAVRTITRTPPRDPSLPASLLMQPEFVSRDSQGRVRFDRDRREVHMYTGPDAGTDIVARNVTICDPVRGEIVQLDNANHAAAIRRLATPSTSSSAYCRVPPNPLNPRDTSKMLVEELGHRSIEGYDTLGWRTTTTTLVPNSSSPATMQRVSDIWCSEELHAVLLQVLGAPGGPKEEMRSQRSNAPSLIRRYSRFRPITRSARIFRSPDTRGLPSASRRWTRGSFTNHCRCYFPQVLT